MWCYRCRKHVGAFGVIAPISKWPGLSLGISLDNEASKIRNLRPDIGCDLRPPSAHLGIEWISGLQSAHRHGRRKRNRSENLHPVRPENLSKCTQVRDAVRNQSRLDLVDVDVVDRDAVDTQRTQEPG